MLKDYYRFLFDYFSELEKMFSVETKKEGAHTDSIWSCDWGRKRYRYLFLLKHFNCGNLLSVSEEGVEPTEPAEEVDILVTGGIDDMVKVWNYR